MAESVIKPDNPPVVIEGADPNLPVVAPVVAASFLDALPVDLKDDKSLAPFREKGVEHLARQYVESQRYNVGAIKIPKLDAPPAEWDAYYGKLGRPVSPEGYTLNRPALPENIPWDAGIETDFKAVAHKLGLTPTQAQGLMDFEGRRIVSGLQGYRGRAEETATALREEWGPAFERNVEIGLRGAKHLGGDALVTALERTGAGNDPAVIKAFVRVGQMLLEDGAISGDVEGVPGPEAARRQANELMADKKGPYWTKADPRHADVRAQVQALFQLAYPDNPA